MNKYDDMLNFDWFKSSGRWLYIRASCLVFFSFFRSSLSSSASSWSLTGLYDRFYTKKTGAGGRLVKLPLASLATLITVHRNLNVAVDAEETDKDGLKAKLDR